MYTSTYLFLDKTISGEIVHPKWAADVSNSRFDDDE